MTRDAFLGGRLSLWQPARGYRAGIDPVLLAAACGAKAGESVLDLGCGVGTAALCLGARVPGLHLFGLERSAEIADLALRNAQEAACAFTVHKGDVAELPSALRALSVNHVICNPPYFLRGQGSTASNNLREAALGEDRPLALWIDVARKRLKPGGWLTLVQRPDRLTDVLAASQGFGAIAIRPVAPRIGREARLVLLQAKKGAKAPMRLLAPLILHKGDRHLRDGDDYSDVARGILRDGRALSWDPPNPDS